MLTEREQLAKDFMENVFLAELHSILRKASPSKYKQWGGNACRQTAIFGTKFLESLLPEYRWTAWDGVFDDVIKGQKVTYNHAWVFGTNNKEGRRLLVDLARLYQERLFVIANSNSYPKDHQEYIDMKEVKRMPIDVESSMNEVEYYTGRSGKEVLQKLIEHCMYIKK
jgi:hypothetical protein